MINIDVLLRAAEFIENQTQYASGLSVSSLNTNLKDANASSHSSVPNNLSLYSPPTSLSSPISNFSSPNVSKQQCLNMTPIAAIKFNDYLRSVQSSSTTNPNANKINCDTLNEFNSNNNSSSSSASSTSSSYNNINNSNNNNVGNQNVPFPSPASSSSSCSTYSMKTTPISSSMTTKSSGSTAASMLTAKKPAKIEEARSRDKSIHNTLEKHRRAHLKECFENLQVVLPTSENKKFTNLQVLNYTLKFVQNIKEINKENEMEKERLLKRRLFLKQKLKQLISDLKADNIDYNKWLVENNLAPLTDVELLHFDEEETFDNKINTHLDLDDGSASTSTASEANDYLPLSKRTIQQMKSAQPSTSNYHRKRSSNSLNIPMMYNVYQHKQQEDLEPLSSSAKFYKLDLSKPTSFTIKENTTGESTHLMNAHQALNSKQSMSQSARLQLNHLNNSNKQTRKRHFSVDENRIKFNRLRRKHNSFNLAVDDEIVNVEDVENFDEDDDYEDYDVDDEDDYADYDESVNDNNLDEERDEYEYNDEENSNRKSVKMNRDERLDDVDDEDENSSELVINEDVDVEETNQKSAPSNLNQSTPNEKIANIVKLADLNGNKKMIEQRIINNSPKYLYIRNNSNSNSNESNSLLSHFSSSAPSASQINTKTILNLTQSQQQQQQNLLNVQNLAQQFLSSNSINFKTNNNNLNKSTNVFAFVDAARSENSFNNPNININGNQQQPPTKISRYAVDNDETSSNSNDEKNDYFEQSKQENVKQQFKTNSNFNLSKRTRSSRPFTVNQLLSSASSSSSPPTLSTTIVKLNNLPINNNNNNNCNSSDNS